MLIIYRGLKTRLAVRVGKQEDLQAVLKCCEGLVTDPRIAH
jgi:hypothetical protein